MDDLEFLVRETFRAHARPRLELPEGPGILYHVQAQAGVFVVRTLPVPDLAASHAQAMEFPEEFPTLRLLSDGGDPSERLRAFATSTRAQAEHVHERVGHRRFPRREEEVCNLSDPGFSWWMETTPAGFILHSKMNWSRSGLMRLGPLADGNVFPTRWTVLASLLRLLPPAVDVVTEPHRFSLHCPSAPWLAAEFASVFARGHVSEELRDLFKLLAKRGAGVAPLETTWYFLEEAAAVRRFWGDVQSGLVEAAHL